MEDMKAERETASVPAAELVWRLAQETAAFEIFNALQREIDSLAVE